MKTPSSFFGFALCDVGTEPIGVVLDGADIWVANKGSNNVMKLRCSDGVVLGTFKAGMKAALPTF